MAGGGKDGGREGGREIIYFLFFAKNQMSAVMLAPAARGRRSGCGHKASNTIFSRFFPTPPGLRCGLRCGLRRGAKKHRRPADAGSDVAGRRC